MEGEAGQHQRVAAPVGARPEADEGHAVAGGDGSDGCRLLVLGRVARVGLLWALQILEEEVGDERQDAGNEALGVLDSALLDLARLAPEDVAAVGNARKRPTAERVRGLAVAADGDVGLIGQRHRLDQVRGNARARRVAEGVGALELRCGDRRRRAGHAEHGRVGGDPRLSGVRRPTGGDGHVADALDARHTREHDAADPGPIGACERVERGRRGLVGVGRPDPREGEDDVVAGQRADEELVPVDVERAVDAGRVEQVTDLGREGGHDEQARNAPRRLRRGLGLGLGLRPEQGGGQHAHHEGGGDTARQTTGGP